MEQAVTKIRETSAHTVAAYPTLELAEDAMSTLADSHVPTQFAGIIATGVHARSRSVLRGIKKVLIITVVGALAATLAELVTHYWILGDAGPINWIMIGWAAMVGAAVGLLGALFLRSAGSRPLEANIFEIMVEDQYAARARDVLAGRRVHELRTEAR